MSTSTPFRRLVVLSNRLPVTLRRKGGRLEVSPSVGGLVAAMEPAMRERGGLWIGWPGAKVGPKETLEVPGAPYDLRAVALSTSEIQRYYHGFSNGALWPLFHSLPDRMSLDPRNFEVYERVNERFAAAAIDAHEDGDLIWIHDYQLALCPEFIRRRRPDARIAMFLHIPFPPFDVYRVLPSYRNVLRGMLACDLVGFHCPGYVTNFEDSVERLLGARVDRDAGRIEHGDQTIRVGAFPLGIDYEEYERRAREAPRRKRPAGEQIILGVDRLDYTKGIPERLRAYERLLERHPEHRGRTTLVQIAVPSREQVSEYKSIKRELDELVGSVNGRFGTSVWTPIRYVHRSIPAARLSALYRDASVGLVTPLRDGMNLVAKEFVASQTDEPGVLVLSRLAGAAETMKEALQVNPYNIESVADALHTALTMARDDRQERMISLQRRERRDNLDAWLESFLSEATRPADRMAPVREADFDSWLGRFVGTRALAVFLDFDGTLVKIANHPSMVRLAPPMRGLLEACVDRKDTDVAIISGRSLSDLRFQLSMDGVALAGNHGLEIEGPGLRDYRHPDVEHYEDRTVDLARQLEAIELDGAWVETKGASLTYHFREAAAEQREGVAEIARQRIQDAGFQPRDALCAVEARPPIGWDKGRAVLHLLREKYGPGWSEKLRVIYVGDDETDEDAFQSLRGLGATFRVGPATRPTLARRRLSDVDAVETLLRWIAQRSPGRAIADPIEPG